MVDQTLDGNWLPCALVPAAMFPVLILLQIIPWSRGLTPTVPIFGMEVSGSNSLPL